MTYEDQEPQQFSIFEVDCIVTPLQANEAWEAICETIDGLRYHVVELLLDKLHMDASNKDVRDYAESLCCEHATLRVRLAAATRAKLADMGVVA